MGRIGIAFLMGHCCIHVLPHLPDLSYVIVLVLALILALSLRSSFAAALVFGIVWSWAHAAQRLAADLPESIEGKDVVVQGYVGSLPELNNGDLRFLFDVVDREPGIPKRLQLTWYKASTVLAVGESWQLQVRLKRRNGFSNPGGFDYEGHLFRAGVGATGYVRAGEASRRLAPANARTDAVDQIRGWIADRMQQAVRDRSMLGVLQGLAIGDTREMTGNQWKVFAATGTTHLMAISGLHISMVAALMAWLGGAIVRWPRAQAKGWCAVHGQALAGSGAALSYALLAGFSVPTQRTLIMLCVYFAARWHRRALSVGHALGLSLVGVLLVDPFAPLSVGAWLSFAAVSVILIAMSGRLVREHAAISFSRVQFAITIGLLPLLLVVFGSVSLISPVANAAAIPLFTLVLVPLVLLGALLASVSPILGGIPLDLATMLLNVFWKPLEWLAEQPAALWHFPSLGPLSLLAMVVGVLLLVLPGIWPLRVLGWMLCSHVLLIATPRPAPGDFELSVLDVGQGLACVVRTYSHVLVYDTGPAFQSGRNASDLAVLPYLHSYGVRHIDMLIVSHGDLDHQGGMQSLTEGLPVHRSLLGSSVLPRPADAQLCARGERWEWDGVSFEILHPPTGFSGTDNDSSCVLLVRGRAGKALLSGDIEAQGEATMLQGWAPSANVVVVPHHGSRTSSTFDFVSAVDPDLAIFSAGYRNRWALPKPDIVKRWKDVGARTLTTAQSGAIEISFAAKQPLDVREHRRLKRRYWSRPAEN
jgi:competence protein ComEC